MIPVSSSEFLKEFTIYAEKAHDDNQELFVQRSNDHNLIVMSMEKYNELQKELYLLRNKTNDSL